MRFHGHRLIKTHPQVKPEVTDMGSSSDLREGYDRKHSCPFVGCAIPQESEIIPDVGRGSASWLRSKDALSRRGSRTEVLIPQIGH